jgi:hypothetical protein
MLKGLHEPGEARPPSFEVETLVIEEHASCPEQHRRVIGTYGCQGVVIMVQEELVTLS